MSLTRTELIPGYPILEINHPTATARVALHGAHLLEWTPAGQSPVLYLSPQAVYAAGQPIRGGIPVCWPWFGPHPSDSTLPAHGFARVCLWDLASHEEDESGVHLTFTLADSPATRLLWPHPFHLTLDIYIGATLHLSLRMTNPGAGRLPLSAALHTYFVTGDIHQTRVSGLHGIPYHEKITVPPDHLQEGDVTFDGEVDRLYDSGLPVKIHDPGNARVLTIEGTGSHSTVVWNPWINKSKLLGDLPDDGYRGFLCVETANAGIDALSLAAGATHTLATTVRVESK